jgi:hypothetical protein
VTSDETESAKRFLFRTLGTSWGISLCNLFIFKLIICFLSVKVCKELKRKLRNLYRIRFIRPMMVVEPVRVNVRCFTDLGCGFH